jgi:hypothetical protein
MGRSGAAPLLGELQEHRQDCLCYNTRNPRTDLKVGHCQSQGLLLLKTRKPTWPVVWHVGFENR